MKNERNCSKCFYGKDYKISTIENICNKCKDFNKWKPKQPVKRVLNKKPSTGKCGQTISNLGKPRQLDWEKEFEKIYMESCFDSSNNTGDKLKDFIKGLLQGQLKMIKYEINRDKFEKDSSTLIGCGYNEAIKDVRNLLKAIEML